MALLKRIQLSLIFFLEFFIWGCCFVTMGTFLSQEFKATGGQLALAYETQSIGAIIAPFVIGLIADRYFEAQKILGTLHIIGASLLYMASNSASFQFLSLHFYLHAFIYAYTSLVKFCGISPNGRPL